MAHTYASLAEFNEAIRTGGAVTFASESAAIQARKLDTLEAVSRRIDQWCQRSRFGSGFGPRTGTNRYDGTYGVRCLQLDDDLLTITGVTTIAAPGATPATLTVETDFYRWPYDAAPYRELRLHETTTGWWSAALRGNVVAGTWGYEDVRVVATSVTTAAVTTTTAVTIAVTSGAEFSPGQTLLIDSEQMYITSISSNSLTVVRGANGTTAATHLISAAISTYRYPTVHDVALRIAVRRWRGPDSSADDGSGLPGVQFREGEDLMLRRALTDVMLRTAG